MGTVNGYGSEIQACFNANCGRSFYGRSTSLGPNDYIYNDASLLSPFNGSGNWYALSFNCTGTFYAYEIQSDGQITQAYNCLGNPESGVCCDCGFGCNCGYVTCEAGCFLC
jgi:hypothetical protein